MSTHGDVLLIPCQVASCLADMEERLDMLYLQPPLGHDTKNSKAGVWPD